MQRDYIATELKPVIKDKRWDGTFELDIEDIEKKRADFIQEHREIRDNLIHKQHDLIVSLRDCEL